jgi:hypothetical protein
MLGGPPPPPLVLIDATKHYTRVSQFSCASLYPLPPRTPWLLRLRGHCGNITQLLFVLLSASHTVWSIMPFVVFT